MGRRRAFGIALLACAGLACAGLVGGRVDELVESAATARDHRAIGNYYRAEATEARKEAAEHRRLAEAYRGPHNWGTAFAERAGAHCNELAALDEERAARYELLAMEHERLAQE